MHLIAYKATYVTVKSFHSFTLSRQSLRAIATNEGDKSKEMAIMGVPFGYEIEWEDLNISRDHEWETSKLNEARRNIYAANGCHPEDTGGERPSANIIGNVTGSLSNKFDQNVVRKYQQMISNFLRGGLQNVIGDISGNESFRGYRFKFSKTAENEREESDTQ